MLLFMYQGDYAIGASNMNGAKPAEAEKQSQDRNAAVETTHLHKTASVAMPNELPVKKSVYDPMTAHVYVYAIAEYYELPDLKTLALKKFAECNAVVNVDEFIEVARAVHLHTFNLEDELRTELLRTLMNKHSDWFVHACVKHFPPFETSADRFAHLY